MFVVLAEGAFLDGALRRRILAAVRDQVSPRHAPDDGFEIPEAPARSTIKSSRCTVRRILMGAPVHQVVNADSMSNPSAIAYFAEPARWPRRAPLSRRRGRARRSRRPPRARRARRRREDGRVPEQAFQGGQGSPAARGRVRHEGADLEAQVVTRDELAPGRRLEGPAIVSQYDTTAFVPPSAYAETDRAGNLVGGFDRG